MHQSACLAAICILTQISGCTDIEPATAEESGTAELAVHYVDSGSGEPVVLVHGFSQTHAAWLDTPLYEDLVRDHRVIAVDLRGHGDSDKPHDPMAYGPNVPTDLIELLNHLEIDKAHFVGFSLGASVVGDVVISYPERVQTATMGSGYFTTWDEGEEEFAQLVEDRASSNERFDWEPENQDYRALAALIRGARYSVASAEDIASISTPTLIVFGSIEVEQMSSSQWAAVQDTSSSVTVMIIDGADHDSRRAAILNPEFTQAVRKLIGLNQTAQPRAE